VRTLGVARGAVDREAGRRVIPRAAGYVSGGRDDGGDMGGVPDVGGLGDLLAGRYEVGPLVGLGGTAEVYRAWDHVGGRPVAVKIFRPGSAPAPGHGGDRELRALAGIAHPGLVAIHDTGVDPQGCPFVVMDYVNGDSLSTRLSDGPLPVAMVTRLGAVLAEALAAVHARGVVHRDVKPANILLDADDRPWLTDFGIARIVDATRVTATGVVVGTAAYMAPEQVRGEPVGPAADVYALGLLLLEAITGRREYDGNALESALARLHRPPRVPADVPDPLAVTLRRMTALEPADRPSAAEVAEVLHRGPAGAAPVWRRPAGRRAIPVAALACLVVAALTGALALVGGKPAVDEPPGVDVAAVAPPTVGAPSPTTAPVPVAAPQPAAGAREPVAVALTSGDRVAQSRGGAATRAAVVHRAVPDTPGSATDEPADDRTSGDGGDSADDDRSDGRSRGTDDDQGDTQKSGKSGKPGKDHGDHGDHGKSGKGGKKDDGGDGHGKG
jgi:eukaryotic-like serine/threonine-protein kinase